MRSILFSMLLAGKAAIPTLWEFFERWPTADSTRKGNPKEIAELLQPLGLYEKRAQILIRMSGNNRQTYLSNFRNYRSLVCFVHFALMPGSLGYPFCSFEPRFGIEIFFITLLCQELIYFLRTMIFLMNVSLQSPFTYLQMIPVFKSSKYLDYISFPFR